MNRKWLVFFTLLILMGVTTGCAQYSIIITEKQDGSALCEYRLGFNPVVLQLISPQGVNPLEDWQQRALAQGFTVQQWQQAHWVEYIANQKVQNLAEISSFNSLFIDTGTTGHPFQINTAIFSDRLELQDGINLTGLWGNLNPEEAQLVQTLIKDVKIQFIYHTQRNILQHNADIVQHKGNTNTLVWYIVPGKNNKILLTAQYTLIRHVAGIGALAVIMIYYIVMAANLLRRQWSVVGGQSNATEDGSRCTMAP